jgi:hypothetical protein
MTLSGDAKRQQRKQTNADERDAHYRLYDAW